MSSSIFNINAVPIIVASARVTGRTALTPTVVAYTPTVDGTFEVTANLLATVSTSYSLDVTVAFTDESGVGRSLKMNMMTVGHVLSNSAALTNANGPLFASVPIHIRAQAGNAISIGVFGTATTVTYNVEAVIKQIA